MKTQCKENRIMNAENDATGEGKDKHDSKSVDVAVKKSEECYRRLFETAQHGILIIDANTGFIDEVNPFMINLLGYKREGFIGEPLWKFGSFRNIRKSRAVFYELLKNGYIHRKHLPLETQRGECLEVEFTGNVYSVGQTRKIQCTIRDESLPNQDEKAGIEWDEQLHKVEKMTSIATLAGVVAYQFNNALAVIKLALGVIQSEKLSLKRDPSVLLIKNAVEKMSRMSGELLSYTRSGRYRIETVCITEIVKTCFPLIKPVLRSSITLETDLPSDLPKIRADRLQVQKALLAIVQNSVEAIETHGRIQVVCQQHVVTPEKVNAFAGLSPGIYVGLTVRDTGKGMNEETRARVFEPFLSARFSGSGLGMAEVFWMVKNHNGWISIESEPDHGTEVSIYFPAVDWVEGLTTGRIVSLGNAEKVQMAGNAAIAWKKPGNKLEGCILGVYKRTSISKLFREVILKCCGGENLKWQQMKCRWKIMRAFAARRKSVSNNGRIMISMSIWTCTR